VDTLGFGKAFRLPEYAWVLDRWIRRKESSKVITEEVKESDPWMLDDAQRLWIVGVFVFPLLAWAWKGERGTYERELICVVVHGRIWWFCCGLYILLASPLVSSYEKLLNERTSPLLSCAIVFFVGELWVFRLVVIAVDPRLKIGEHNAMKALV